MNGAGASRPVAAGPPPIDNSRLTQEEVDTIVRVAARTVGGDRFSVAVVDRRGALLAVFHRPGAGPAEDELALSLARTGAFFGQNQAPLTSRTVRFISGIHFPPGIRNQGAANLYGIELTNRVDRRVTFEPGKFYPPPLNVDGTGPSLGITTGKRDVSDRVPYPQALNAAGIPIYKRDGNGVPNQVGGVGVAGMDGTPAQQIAWAEHTAFRASGGEGRTPELPGFGFLPESRFPPRKAIFVEGIRLPLYKNKTRPRGMPPGFLPAEETAFYRFGPAAGEPAPDGYLVGPTDGVSLTAAEADAIIQSCVRVANRTRAAIRLPTGSRTRMVISVADTEGNILGTFRMPDSTIFSIDVAIAKARNVVYFSGPDRLPAELPGLPVGTAVTNRSLGFCAQPLFPSGINGTRPGPFFQLFLQDLVNPGTQGSQPPNGRQNGVVFFPGSAPLYRNGVLVGGLGVSGDGVDQDDTVTFYGAQGWHAPPAIRADQYEIRGIRVPYLKFLRNPFR